MRPLARLDAALGAVVVRYGPELATAAAIASGVGLLLALTQPPAHSWLAVVSGPLLVPAALLVGYRARAWAGSRRGWGTGVAAAVCVLPVVAWMFDVFPNVSVSLFLEELATYLGVATLEWHRRLSVRDGRAAASESRPPSR